MLGGVLLSLWEGACSEARRFDHATPGAAHLALALDARAPGLLGRDVRERLIADLRSGPGEAFDVASFLERCVTHDPAEILSVLEMFLPDMLGAPTHTPVREWQVGDVILDRYEVLGVAGQGGMGRVHRVRHLAWGIDVAVKSPLPGMLDFEEGRAAFEREAQLWVELGLHPHVCACHYVRRIDGVPRVFSEYADRGSLDAAIADRSLYRGGDVLARLLELAIHAAAGLAHAHAHGVVHQDVKPANVLLAGDGDAKVSDFGLARAGALVRYPGPGGGDPQVSYAGMTPAYCSPEQARRAGALTAATDVWSLALTILQLFTGEPPSRSGVAGNAALASFVVRGAQEPGLPAMPPRVAELLGRCLQPEPAARPGMEQLRDELAACYERATGSPYAQAELPEATLVAGELSNQALSMLDLERRERAEELWQRALEHDPRHPQATYNQGLHLWRTGRLTDEVVLRRLEAVGAGELLGQVLRERVAVRGSFTIDGSAEALALTPDGHTMVLADPRGGARLTRAGTVVAHAPRPADDGFCAAAIGPDGDVAVLGSHSGTGWVWRRGRDPAPALFGHTAQVDAVALGAGGRLALTGSRDGTARLWALEPRRFRSRLQCLGVLAGHSGPVEAVALGDATAIAVTAGHDGTLRVWDPTTARCRMTIPAHRDWIRSVAMRGDGRLALTGCQDQTACLWDLQTGQRLATLHGVAAIPWSVALSDDGAVALTGGDDGALRVWSTRERRCLATVAAHARVDALGITADARRAVTAGAGEPVRVWDLEHELREPAPFAYARPRPTREAARLAAQLGTGLREVEQHLEAGRATEASARLRELRSVVGHERDPALRALWRRTGRQLKRGALLGAWPAGEVRAHETPGQLRGDAFGAVPAGIKIIAHTTPGRSSRIRDVALNADGTRTITVSHDGWARSWLIPGLARGVGMESTDWMTAVAMTPAGDLALVGTNDGRLCMWRPGGSEPARVFQTPNDPVDAVAVTSDGMLAVTASFTGAVYVWDLTGGTATAVFADQRSPVALTPAGHRLLTSGCDDHVVRVWQRSTGGLLAAFEHGEYVRAAAISADGRRAVTRAGAIFVWDVDTARRERRFGEDVHDNALALSADGLVAVSGGFDRILRVWDVESGACLAELPGHAVAIGAVALTPDAGVAASVSDDGALRVWELDWDHRPEREDR